MQSTYGNWEDTDRLIRPILHTHGFGLSFRTEEGDGCLYVTSVLAHRDGHSEQTTLRLPIDTSGSKNVVQGAGSSLSYGKRSTAGPIPPLSYQDDPDKPPNMGVFIADAMTASFAVMGIQAAIIQRTATGRGQMVDATLMESMANLLVYEFQEAQFPVEGRRPVYKPSRAADGYIIIAAVNDNNFASLFKAMGREDWLTDPRYATNDARQKNWDELFREIEAWTGQRTTEDCEATLTQAGVPCSAYRSVAELIANPHFIARGSFQSVADSAGDLLVPNLPFRLTDGDVSVRPAVADRGANTDSIRQERLFLSATTVDRRRADGVFG